MAKEFDNTNRGALFRNDRKLKDSHPDHTGTLNIDGVEYWLSAWVKDGKRGKFFSLAIKPKEDRNNDTLTTTGKKPPVAPKAKTSQDFDDDDIPF